MLKYVNYNTLLDVLERDEEYHDSLGDKKRADGVRDALIDLYTCVDCINVCDGEWRHRKSWDRYVCSECSFESTQPYKFCPGCGARMDGGSIEN